ncbi:hypothetical protein TWF694_011238 [Orbilia ellipsospora]|uniref:F-box domain-containing protein n=1 Tax=Orbilia ellipsospora TaxID=2528407 RepID=A0AAV9X8F4_9PEZI
MKLELIASPPDDAVYSGAWRSGPFSFAFVPPNTTTKRVGRISRQPTQIEDLRIEQVVEEEADTDPAPIQRLPAEIHTLIASFVSVPSQIVHLSWTCRKLYASLGPSNRFFWYTTLHRKTRELVPPSGHEIPSFSQETNYYQKCIDIMCNREKESGCQRCLLYEPTMYNKPGLKKNDEKRTQMVDIYVARIFHGTWCWNCATEVFECTLSDLTFLGRKRKTNEAPKPAVSIVQQTTPMPFVPPTLLTEIRHHPCGHKKPGFFVSRANIAAEYEKQCPNGAYSKFDFHQDAQPDIREAKPYIMKTVMGMYTEKYKHMHVLFPPAELAKEIKECLQIKTFKMSTGLTRKNAIVDAAFALAKTYIECKQVEDEGKRDQDRLNACAHFLQTFFGSPNEPEKEEQKIHFPTTRFIAFLAKQYWVRRMEEMGRPTSEAEKRITIRYCVDENKRSPCGFCVTKDGKSECDADVKCYSPVLLVFHMIAEHLDRITEDWPEVQVPKKKKEAKVEEKEKEESVEDENNEEETSEEVSNDTEEEANKEPVQTEEGNENTEEEAAKPETEENSEQVVSKPLVTEIDSNDIKENILLASVENLTIQE